MSLILALVVGLGFSYLALQNTQGVTLQFQQWQITNIPVYVLVIASMLIGLFISFAISLADSIAQTMTMFSKDHKIKSTEKSLESLEGKIHQLEIENARLKTMRHEPSFMRQSMFEKPNIFQKLRHRFSI